MDRDQSNDVLDTTPVAGSVHTLYPATTCGQLTSLMPLTDVLDLTGCTNLNAKIDAMKASGNTNVTIGLVWAWHALTPNLPLTEAQRSGSEQIGQGDHSAHRRHQYAEPLVLERIEHRCPHRARLHQREGGEYQDLYGARDRRRHDAAQELRHASRTCITTWRRQASSTACSPRSRRRWRICGSRSRRRTAHQARSPP